MKHHADMPETRAGWIALMLRVSMGAWFVYAGGLKVFATGLGQFVTDIENYKLVEGRLALLVAYFIPWLEIVAGLCFMAGVLRKGSWLAMLGLVMAFTFSVGSAWWRGLDIRCGCIGGTEPISYWKKAIEFGAYYAALAWIAWVDFRKVSVPNSPLVQ